MSQSCDSGRWTDARDLTLILETRVWEGVFKYAVIISIEHIGEHQRRPRVFDLESESLSSSQINSQVFER